MKGRAGPAGTTAQNLADNAAIKNLYVVAITEQIASALERRLLEMARLYPPWARPALPIWPRLGSRTQYGREQKLIDGADSCGSRQLSRVATEEPSPNFGNG
jgi:hypothetical protein